MRSFANSLPISRSTVRCFRISSAEKSGPVRLSRSIVRRFIAGHASVTGPGSKPASRRSLETRVRYGRRRVHVMLRREGFDINIKRTHRIYNELGLQLRIKTPKRRVKAKLRDDHKPATRPNDVRAMDFGHDQSATGRSIRILTVVDTFSRFSPVIDPRAGYRAENVVETLERVCADLGYPRTIRVDQGSEFVSRDLDLWAYAKGVTLDFSRPAKPTDNAFIEAFNGRFRSECLNAHWFLTLADAREEMEVWLRYYDEVRPHGAIGNKPPISLQNSGGAAGPSP